MPTHYVGLNFAHKKPVLLSNLWEGTRTGLMLPAPPGNANKEENTCMTSVFTLYMMDALRSVKV